MKNKKALLICYYFPPLGGAGIGRPLSIFKYLPRFGYDCEVLTVKTVTYRMYEPELLEGLELKKIHRSRSFDPQRLMYLLGVRKIKDTTISKNKIVSDRFFPDPKIGWVKQAVKLGRTLIENRRYDIIMSTSPPMSAHLAGMKLAREFSLPWVADFRDFWTGYKVEEWFENERAIKKGQELLKEITTNASRVTVVNPAIAEYLGGGDVIYNSYDEYRAKLWQIPTEKKKYKIGVLGTIDELRPLEPLFSLLAELKKKNRDLYDMVEIEQVGVINLPDVDKLISQYELADKIHCHNLQKRQETIALLGETSMLYIGIQPPYGNGVLPGRFFDMAVSGRTLLGYGAPDSVVANLINETGNGFVFDDKMLEAGAEYLADKIGEFKKGELIVEPIPPYARKYSSLKMVENVAGVFDQLVKS